MKFTMLGFALVTGLGVSACSGTARGLEAYRADTQRLLDTRDAQLMTCYDAALKADAKLAGTVTVQFVIEKHSGAIAHVVIDPATSTASPALADCVVNAVGGLALAPADRHEGRATFVYEFKSTPATPAMPTS